MNAEVGLVAKSSDSEELQQVKLNLRDLARKCGTVASYVAKADHHVVYALGRAAMGMVCAQLPADARDDVLKAALARLDEVLDESAKIRR